MSRLVRGDAGKGGLLTFGARPVTTEVNSPGAPEVAGAPPGTTTEVDGVAARMVKYIPAEVIAFYLAADKLFKSPSSASTSPSGPPDLVTGFIDGHLGGFAAAIFIIALVGAFGYVWLQSDRGQPWFVHAAMSTLSFVIWSYAIEGGFFTKGAYFFQGTLYDVRLASTLVSAFTFLSGFVIPSAGSSRDTKDKADTTTKGDTTAKADTTAKGDAKAQERAGG